MTPVNFWFFGWGHKAHKYTVYLSWRHASNWDNGGHQTFHIIIFKTTPPYQICACLPAHGLPQNNNGEFNSISGSKVILLLLFLKIFGTAHFCVVITMERVNNSILSLAMFERILGSTFSTIPILFTTDSFRCATRTDFIPW